MDTFNKTDIPFVRNWKADVLFSDMLGDENEISCLLKKLSMTFIQKEEREENRLVSLVDYLKRKYASIEIEKCVSLLIQIWEMQDTLLCTPKKEGDCESSASANNCSMKEHYSDDSVNKTKYEGNTSKDAMGLLSDADTKLQNGEDIMNKVCGIKRKIDALYSTYSRKKKDHENSKYVEEEGSGSGSDHDEGDKSLPINRLVDGGEFGVQLLAIDAAIYPMSSRSRTRRDSSTCRNQLSGMYNLGMMFLDMIHPFYSSDGREAIIRQLKGMVLETHMASQFPQLAHLVELLGQKQVDSLPSSNEIMNCMVVLAESAAQSFDQCNMQLKEELARKDRRIAALQQYILLHNCEDATEG